MLKEDLYQEFCYLDDYAISIEYQNDLYIVIYKGLTMNYSNKIIESNWIQLDIHKQGIIVIDEKNLNINSIDQINFTQIKKNYNDFYLEITKDDKYNNFILQNWRQPYLFSLTFDAFISDSDALVTLWFKLMIDYNTINCLSIQSYKDNSFHNIDILQIFQDQLILFIDDQKKEFRINEIQWNQVIIQIQDNINVQVITNNLIIQENYTYNIKNIINKQIFIEQEGLYVGHLSIQYKDIQFYCSPGCITCQNNKCQECEHDQYLVHNQCQCHKFYESQDIDGQCRMYTDLYEQNQLELDYDLFQENFCQFGFIYSQGNCYPCPWFQDNQLCSDCIYKPKLHKDQKLYCWQNEQQVQYVFDKDQYRPYIKEYSIRDSYNIISNQVKQQSKLLKNNTQLIIDQKKKIQFRSGLVYKGLLRCPYNCGQCQRQQKLNYCINLIENENYTQNIQGIPISNNLINTFVIKIQVINFKSNQYYIHNERYYRKLDDIIDNIEINSIILTGIHIIYLIFELQIQYIDQVLFDLEINLKDLKLKINKAKEYYIGFDTPFIHLDINSNMKYLIKIDNYIYMRNIDKLTIQNIYFISSFSFIKINAAIIIMKNIYFKSTQIDAYFICNKILIQNVIFEDIIDFKANMFKIHTNQIKIYNLIINNCTLDQVNLFQLASFSSKNFYVNLIIDQFYVYQSTLILSQIIDIYQNNCLITIENFILDYSKLVDSNIIYTDNKNTELKLIRNLFILNSQIFKSLFSQFMKQTIDTIIIYNCTLENIFSVFKIIQESDDVIRIRNIFLDQIKLIQVQLFYIQTKSAVDLSFLIIKDVQLNQKLTSLFHIQTISVQLSFIKLQNLQINSFVTIIAEQVFILFINTLDSQIQEVFTIQSYFVIKMQNIIFLNISQFYRIVNLKSYYITKLQQIKFANFSLNQFEKINQFIYFVSDFRGQVLMKNLYFLNNQICDTNYTFNFIEIDSPFQVITLFQLYFINNFIKTQIGNIITIKSKGLLINSLYIKNLTLINNEMVQINALDLNGSSLELQNMKFKTINLVNCHLICQKGPKLYVIYIYLNGLALANSKLIYIAPNQIFLTTIIKLKASLIKTNDALIKINSENSEGDLDFYYSQISNISLEKDLISLSSDIFKIRIYKVKFLYVMSINPIYLIKQLSNQYIQVLQLFELVIDNSQFGLVKVNGCDYLQIDLSQFNNIRFSEQFVLINKNFQFTLEKAVFKNVQIFQLLHIQQSNQIKNKIILVQLLFQNLRLQNHHSLIVFNYGNQQILSHIYLINNSCTHPIFQLQNYSNISNIHISNFLFSLNNVTKIFDFSNNSNIQTGREQQQANYIYINNKSDIPEFFSQQQWLEDYTIKVKINDFHLESYIQIEYKLNNIEQNQPKSKYDSFYLPSGQFLNKYKILNLNQLSFKQYIYKFVIFSNNKYDCHINLIQNNIIDNINEVIQTKSIKINQDLSSILRLQMDPYNGHNYQLQVNCQHLNIQSVLQFKIKPFPCQMGEYYYNQQCNLCELKCQYNTLKRNQNNCDYFDKSIVSEMQQGLLKLKIGYWRPDYHNKYIQLCEKYSQQQNCQGGWQVGDQSCYQGYLGALCSECDIYNQRGHGHYSKIEEKCVSCSNGNFKLIAYITTIFFYQLIQTTLAARRSYQYISNKKKLIQSNRFYIILKSLQVDQISICLKILQDMYIKLILINKLQFEIPDIINIGFNIFPQQLVNEGPNILVLELIYIFIFTIVLIQVSNFIYIIIVYKKLIQQSITYITSIFQYGYKQSYFYISYLLLSQIIYVEVSNELYLVGNQQYSFKYYKHITIIILPIFIVYSIVIPLLIIFIINKKRSNIQNFSKYWAYYIQDYNSTCQFWELYQLIKYSFLLFIYFYYYLERNNQLMLFIIAILIDLIIQKNISIYNIKNLNQIYFETQIKLIALLILFNYYQVLTKPLKYILLVLILILNYYILKPILYNIFRIIIAKYIHFTFQYQNKLVVRYPRFMNFQRRYSLGQNPDRAKKNFQKLIKLFKNNKLGQHKFAKPIIVHHAPQNTSYLELQTSKEVEMITL